MNAKSCINIIYNIKNGIMPMYKSNKREKYCIFQTSRLKVDQKQKKSFRELEFLSSFKKHSHGLLNTRPYFLHFRGQF